MGGSGMKFWGLMGKPFFDKESLTEPDEIRLGVTFAVDWCVSILCLVLLLLIVDTLTFTGLILLVPVTVALIQVALLLSQLLTCLQLLGKSINFDLVLLLTPFSPYA